MLVWIRKILKIFCKENMNTPIFNQTQLQDMCSNCLSYWSSEYFILTKKQYVKAFCACKRSDKSEGFHWGNRLHHVVMNTKWIVFWYTVLQKAWSVDPHLQFFPRGPTFTDGSYDLHSVPRKDDNSLWMSKKTRGNSTLKGQPDIFHHQCRYCS